MDFSQTVMSLMPIASTFVLIYPRNLDKWKNGGHSSLKPKNDGNESLRKNGENIFLTFRFSQRMLTPFGGLIAFVQIDV